MTALEQNKQRVLGKERINLSTKIGEIIEAKSGEFVAQCYELYQAPSLGSLVKTRDAPVEIYGVVAYAATSSLEPGRRPIARGKEEAQEEDIYRSNPQLAHLLRTEFTVLVVGHSEKDSLHYFLSPRPARLHSFVYLCEAEEVRRFSRSLHFLPLLLQAQPPVPVDEVVAACLRLMGEVQEDRSSFLVAAGKELALLLGGELARLNALLRRIKG